MFMSQVRHKMSFHVTLKFTLYFWSKCSSLVDTKYYNLTLMADELCFFFSLEKNEQNNNKNIEYIVHLTQE